MTHFSEAMQTGQGFNLFNPALNKSDDCARSKFAQAQVSRGSLDRRATLYIHGFFIFLLSLFLVWQAKEAFSNQVKGGVECWVYALLAELLTYLATIVLASELPRSEKAIAWALLVLNGVLQASFFVEVLQAKLQLERPELKAGLEALAQRQKAVEKWEQVYESIPDTQQSRRAAVIREIQRGLEEMNLLRLNLKKMRVEAPLTFTEAYHIFLRLGTMVLQILLLHWLIERLTLVSLTLK